MLVYFLLACCVFYGCLAEQVPCSTGKAVCEASESLSVISDEFFCCDQGFNMQWTSRVVNGSTTNDCLCNRHFYVSDCIEDQQLCQGASSFTSDGVTTKCCRGGDSMNSVYNSMVNGVRADYCKCIRYVGSGGNRWASGRPSGGRPWNRAKNAVLLGGPLGFGQMAGQFLESLGRGIHETLAGSGNNDIASPKVQNADLASGTTGLPNNQYNWPGQRWPLFNPQQRLSQVIQPQRFQHTVRQVSNILDSLGQNPGALFDPRWWLGQDWRGMFNPPANGDRTTDNPISGNGKPLVQAAP